MPKKNLLKFLYLIIILLGFFILIIYSILYRKQNTPEPLGSFSEYQQKINLADLPLRLYIPKINLDAPIDQVGLTSDGKMGAPGDPSTTGWLNTGTIPGQVGSAVIDGHFGWKDNIPAVFDDLHKLKIGDYVYVENAKKEVITFIVRDIKKFDKNEDTNEVFYSKDSLSHLNLITCMGVWNTVEQSHQDRLVIFTDKVNDL